MSTMIEKVARALAAKHYADRLSKAANDEHVNMNVDGNWPVFVDDAKVAIESMRAPTEAMYKAAMDAFVPPADAAACWHAMLHAALIEETQP